MAGAGPSARAGPSIASCVTAAALVGIDVKLGPSATVPGALRTRKIIGGIDAVTWLGENKERAPFAVSTVLLLGGGAAWLLSEFGADREAGAGMVPASAAGGAAGVARVPAARPAGV